MVSHENRVLLASLALVGVLAVIATAVDLGSSALVTLTIVAGVGVLAPQLYLARTDDSIDPRRRLRAGVVVTLVFTWAMYNTASGDEKWLVAGVGLVLFAGFFVYEAVGGYRESMASP